MLTPTIKNGGDLGEDGNITDIKVRPVCTGEFLSRIANRIAWSEAKDDVIQEVYPRQLGVGIPDGCLRAIHMANLLMDTATSPGPLHPTLEDWVIVNLDQKCAHNFYSRSIAQQRWDALPSDACKRTAALHRALYSHPIDVRAKTRESYEHIAKSLDGGIQGDPITPGSYCLVLNELIREIEAGLHPPGEASLGYIKEIQDDILIVGKKTKIIPLLEEIKEKIKRIGGELNE